MTMLVATGEGLLEKEVDQSEIRAQLMYEGLVARFTEQSFLY
jgi:hypothetical protein